MSAEARRNGKVRGRPQKIFAAGPLCQTNDYKFQPLGPTQLLGSSISIFQQSAADFSISLAAVPLAIETTNSRIKVSLIDGRGYRLVSRIQPLQKGRCICRRSTVTRVRPSPFSFIRPSKRTPRKSAAHTKREIHVNSCGL